MNILIACEYSGRVRNAFAARGHDAVSCDFEPAEDGSAKHFQGDVFELLARSKRFDLMVAHPPCTYLSNSGVRHLFTGERDETGERLLNTKRWKDMIAAAAFFKRLLDLDIDKIAIENPIMHGYGVEIIGQRATQFVQPWMFGHPEQKATGLWLKGLDPLVPTDNVKEAMLKLPKAQRQRLHYLSPGPNRWKERSRTFQGLADGMAAQWG